MPLTIAVITDGFMLKDTRGITLQEIHAIITNCYIKKQKHLVGQMLIIVSLRQLNRVMNKSIVLCEQLFLKHRSTFIQNLKKNLKLYICDLKNRIRNKFTNMILSSKPDQCV